MTLDPHIHVDNLILGAGLAGLSAAYHAKGNSLVIEREGEVGGTARSFKLGGFTFDFTGHLLHLHNPYTKALITKLLKNNFYECERNAAIFSHNTYTRYPFQANTKGLPEEVIDECVLGFIRAYLDNQKGKKDFHRMDFETWCRQIFGDGISNHFMVPYNEKLYQVPAHSMTVDWCGPFVPTPKPEEVIRGAIEDQDKGFGYNTKFLYPKKGGIQALAQALAASIKNIALNTTIQKINWKEKRAQLSNGQEVVYKNFINTVPLAEFLRLLPALPGPVESERRRLKCVGILCMNIGVNRAKISDKSWIYFPEKQFPFYRVGFPMNFTPHVVPKGCSSMYVEVPFNIANLYPQKVLLAKVRKGLIEARILKPSDKLPVVQFLPIRYAYVIYDKARTQALRTIFDFFGRNGIQSIGRYGAWKYSFMEEAILDGKKAAESLSF